MRHTDKLAFASSVLILALTASGAPHAQTCPITCPAGEQCGRTGAAEIDTLGYSRDTVYNLSFTFPHSASSLTLDFAGANLQALVDESWGIDNVAVRAGATLIYLNDFEGVVGPEWSATNVDTTPSGRRFLGQFGNGTISLALGGLPAHSKITVSFNLFVINTWDGSASAPFGPDMWSLSSGGLVLLDTTFSNFPEFHCQDFPEEGCTPGFWKTHPEAWPTAYSPAQSVASVFTVPSCLSSCSVGGATLIQALDFGGGAGACGGARNLLRAAVASLLNAASDDVSFPRKPAQQVINDVNAALASCNRATMLLLATQLDVENNLGCPLR